jgi:hypothetical protein
LDVIEALVDRMKRFCGDTRVVVLSDGPTGLGGDPDEALAHVAKVASQGVTVSTVAAATGLRRVQQLEQLAWVGYGQHHHADTLEDMVRAVRSDLRSPGWVARDVQLAVNGAEGAAVQIRPLSPRGLTWFSKGLGRGDSFSGLYEVVLEEGDQDGLVEVSWSAGSPVEGEWTRSGRVLLNRRDVPASFGEGAQGVRMAWVASDFARAISGEASLPLEELYRLADAARRDDVRSDVELLALIDRAKRLQQPSE